MSVPRIAQEGCLRLQGPASHRRQSSTARRRPLSAGRSWLAMSLIIMAGLARPAILIEFLAVNPPAELPWFRSGTAKPPTRRAFDFPRNRTALKSPSFIRSVTDRSPRSPPYSAEKMAFVHWDPVSQETPLSQGVENWLPPRSTNSPTGIHSAAWAAFRRRLNR